MKIRLLAAARPFERARRPLRHAFVGNGVANLTLPGLAALVPPCHQIEIQDEQNAPLNLSGPMDLALITAKACFAPRAYEIADALRARGVPVVMGGCHVSLNPQEASTHCDAVVIGEAESAMSRLLDDAEHHRLAAVYRGEQADMATVPLPRRDLLQKRYIIDAVVVSRGCNFACRFCCIRGFYGRGFRPRPVAHVLQEVRALGKYIGFHDENLVADRAYARELFAALAPLGRRWLGQVSADLLEEPDLIELAAKSGARGFHIGLESINPRNLDAEAKGHNRVEAYTELVARCHHAGVLVASGVMFGLDGDTPDTFAETLEALEAIGVDVAYFKMATPYPGTEFYRRLEGEGRILTRDWSYYDGCFPTFVPKHMTPRQLYQGTRWAASQFYSAKRLARRLPQYLKLELPLWASLNMNRLAVAAYQHSVRLGDRFLEEVGR